MLGRDSKSPVVVHNYIENSSEMHFLRLQLYRRDAAAIPFQKFPQMRNYVQANAGTRMELVRLYESARDLANLRAVDATDLAKNSEANEEKLREIVLTGLRASILLEKESPKNLPPRINQLLEKEFELYLRSLSPREEVRPGVSEWRSHFEAWRAELEQ